MTSEEKGNRYANGKIYTIRSYLTDEIYVGSTTESLCKRLYKHKAQRVQYLKGKSNFTTSYDILEKGDAYIELLESFPCQSKDELFAREGHHIRTNDCVNKQIPGRTRKQYAIDNAVSIKEHKRQYNIDNFEAIKKDKRQYAIDNAPSIKQYKEQYAIDNAVSIKEHKRQYNIDNFEAIKKQKQTYNAVNAEIIRERTKLYRANNETSIKNRKKQYAIDNAESIAQRNKQWRSNNAQMLKEKSKTKITCEYCNKTMSRCSLTNHNRSITHVHNFIQF